MRHRYHILGVPHAITTREYSTCAFTQKIVKLCGMLRSHGHHVIHYGHQDSVVDCDEHVTVTTRDDMEQSYPGHDWKVLGHPAFDTGNEIYRTFYANAIAAIRKRQQPRDFLLCMWGSGHKPVADGLSDLIVCEPGIGYPGGSFAPFRVFESYAILHATLGLERVGSMHNGMWYDAVIPNYFDLRDFTFEAEKDEYLLFLGRVGAGKGTHIALQIAEATGKRLIIAGPGEVVDGQTRTSRPWREYAEHVGVVGPEQRAALLSKAKATICASMYVEPFCGVQIESMLSGTPVISTDWGAFTEYNLHGVTGYRCRTFEQFVWAARNVGRIDPTACYLWAKNNFSCQRVAEMYEEYFWSVMKIYDGSGGFYAPKLERTELDWLRKWTPPDG